MTFARDMAALVGYALVGVFVALALGLVLP